MLVLPVVVVLLLLLLLLLLPSRMGGATSGMGSVPSCSVTSVGWLR